MSKEKIENGVTIDNRIRITSDITANRHIFYVLLQVFLSYIGTLTILYSWIKGMDLEVDDRTLLAGVLASVVVLMLIEEVPRFRLYIGVVYLLIIAAFCYYNWDYIQNGFYCVENAIIKYAADYYNLNAFRYIVYLDPYTSTTYLFLATAQLIVIITTLEVAKHYMRSVYVFLVLLFYCTLLALGITPDSLCLMLQALTYLSMRAMDWVPNGIHRKYLGHKSETYEANAKGKQRLCLHSAISISIVFLVAYLLVRMIVTPYFYDRNVNILPTKRKLQKAVAEFSLTDTVNNIKKRWQQVKIFDSDNSSYSGGLDSGKIGDVGNISFSGEVALTVALDTDISYLYLKGFAGDVYKGDEWAQLSQEDSERYKEIREEFEDSYQAETLLYEWMHRIQTYGVHTKVFNETDKVPDFSMDKRDIYIKYEDANRKFLYAPYTCNYLGVGDVNYLNDSYVKPPSPSQANYLFTDNYVCYNSDSSLNDLMNMVNYVKTNCVLDRTDYNPRFEKFEQEYRKFAHDVYTRLPVNKLEQLKAIDLGVDNEDGNNSYEVVNKVIEYLSTNTTYSLSPGVPDSNQDFAEYFLFDAKKGFCSHYATAAVLLLRNYGVPARYIEGYVVTKKDIEEGKIKDSNQPNSSVAVIKDYNAHAWVEVYIDDVGWVPVEVTNGYSEDGVSDLIPEIEGKEPTVTPTPTVTAAPTATPTTNPKATQEPTAQPTVTPTPIAASGSQKDHRAFHMPIAVVIILTILLALIVLIVGLYFRYRIRKIRMKQFLTRGSQRHRVIANYMAIEQLLYELKIIKKEAQTYEEFAKQALIQSYLLPEGFEKMVALALKAKFSDEDIPTYETKAICKYYFDFRENYSESLSKKEKFIFKYWKVL